MPTTMHQLVNTHGEESLDRRSHEVALSTLEMLSEGFISSLQLFV